MNENLILTKESVPSDIERYFRGVLALDQQDKVITSAKLSPCKVGCSKFESKIRYKKWCYFGAAKLLIFNTLIYEIVL